MRFLIPTALLLTISAVTACGQSPSAPASGSRIGARAASSAASRSASTDDFHFGPAPAVFPPGAEMAVLEGNPGGTGLFTVRLRFPDGYKIAPHTHPTDENVTVISGTFSVGMGSTFVEQGMLALPAGGFVTAPAEHAHYAKAHGVTVVQVHALGPFALTYVNPADNPAAGASH